MMLSHDIKFMANDRIMLIGTTGSGKSNLLKHLVKKLSFWNVLIYDDEDEHEGLVNERVKRYVPEEVGEEKRIIEFNMKCREVYRSSRLMFVVENVDLYAYYQKPLPDNFWLIVKKGRKRGIGVLMVSQRIVDVHKFPCSQSHHWFIFQTHLDNEIKKLRTFIGKTVEDCISLPDYHFVYWNKRMKMGRVMTPVPLEFLRIIKKKSF